MSGRNLTLLLSWVGLLGVPHAPAAAEKAVVERINPSTLAAPRGYTHVVTARGGRMVFVSGQVALDGRGELVGKNDLRAQAQQVWSNLKAALAAAGATFKDVVKLNTYVVNFKAEDVTALREARSAALGDAPAPASTLVGVQALARDEFLLEIEALAVVD